MKLKRSHRAPLAEINITPLTDVILVVLIIFMITTPLLSQDGFKVNLPKTVSAGEIKQEQVQVNLAITSEGLIYLDKDLVTEKELTQKLRKLIQGNQEVSALVCADKDCAFEDVAGVLDKVNAVGISKINLATNPTK